MTKMDCGEMELLLEAAIDGELDLLTQMAFDAHLAACPACRTAHGRRLALVHAVRAEASRHAVPAGLAARLLAALPEEDPAEPPPAAHPSGRGIRRWLGGGAGRVWGMVRGRMWGTLSGAAAGAALAAGLMLALPAPPSPALRTDDAMTQSLVQAHIRSLMPDHLTDVPSSDKHMVKPWFNGRLALSPPVPNLDDAGYPLVGGRLDYVDGRTAAAVVYRRARHVINLFAWAAPDRPDQPVRHLARNGYTLLAWTSGGVAYAAVSDLNLQDLETFRQLWAARSGEGAGNTP